MSQVAFADEINVSKQTLYKYENDIVTNIPSDKMRTLQNSAVFPPLISWDGKIHPPSPKVPSPTFPNQW
ncbi:MAG: helix-turn-helix domain-containing protein [Anaerotignum faecicola]